MSGVEFETPLDAAWRGATSAGSANSHTYSRRSSHEPAVGSGSLGARGDTALGAGKGPRLPRWLRSWSCLCGGKALEPLSSSSLLSQPGGSPVESVAPGHRSNPSVAGSAGTRNAAGRVICSTDSLVGPLPSCALQCLPDNPAPDTGEPAHSEAAAATASGPAPVLSCAVAGVQYGTHGSSPSGAGSAHSGNSTQAQVVVLTTNGVGTTGGSTHQGWSRASSRTSCVTTTSRPSRWSVLANILSAGLRSFTQVAHIVEPNTGHLTLETVHDLTRRASRLDMLRAVGQVTDLSLVGSGSMGLVYRGRVSEGGATVCVKYLVSRGGDGMAAMATEGLLNRALAHPNIIVTHGWHVTRITSDNFLELSEALAAMAARDKHRPTKRTSSRAGAVGKVRRGARRHTAAASSAAARAPSTGPARRGSAGASVSVPQLGLSSGSGCHGSRGCDPAARHRATSPDLNAGGLTSNVFDLALAATGLGGMAKGRAASLHGSTLSRIGSMHGSFTSTCRGSYCPEAASPPMPVLSQRGSHQPRAAGLAQAAPQPSASPAAAVPPLNSAQMQLEGPWPMRRVDLYEGLNEASSTLLLQADACDAAAAAAAAVAAARSGPHGGIGTGTGTSNIWLTRESLSSHWIGPSPSVSNHRRNTQDTFARSTYGDGSSHYNGAGFAGSPGSAVAPARPGTGPAAPLLQPSAPVAVAACPSRVRSMLVRTGSRLQVATTPNTQPSIPEAAQATESGEEEQRPSVRGAGGGGSDGPVSFGLVAQPAVPQPEEGRHLREMLISADAGTRCASVVSGSRRHAAVATAAVTTLGGSVRGSSLGLGLGEDSTALSVGSLRAQPVAQSTERVANTQCEGSPGRPLLGLLAAALAAQGRASLGRLPSVSLANDARPGGSQYTPTVSCSMSTVPTLSNVRTTTSSKRLSSAATVPPLLVHSMQPVAGGTGTVDAAISLILSTPSALGSGPGAAVSAAMSAGAIGASGSATGTETATGTGTWIGSGPTGVACGGPELETEAVRRAAVERGWRTLQHILRRLNARPGDYLTRIVMEDADQGSLLNAMRQGRFDATVRDDALPTLLLTALDIGRGMAFLHGHNVIHGDLKLSNILLRSESADPRGFVAKVSDFGLSRIIAQDNDSVRNDETFPMGTVAYMAPETVSGSSFKASDVWSFGVVLWQLVTGEVVPWPGLRSVQIMMGVMQGELRLTVPPSAYPPVAHLIESCMSQEHTQRPSFSDIVLGIEVMLRGLSRSSATSGSDPHLPAPAAAACASPALDMWPPPPAAPAGADSPGAWVPDAAARGGTSRGPPSIAPTIPSAAAHPPCTGSPGLASSTADEAGDEPPPRTISVAASAARELPLELVPVPPAVSRRSSLGTTWASLTGPGPSSNQLTHMSSSWANTTDRDPRSSAWPSSALHITATTTANHGGVGAYSFGASAGVSNSTGTMAMEQLCLQELFSRQRLSEDSLPPDERASGAAHMEPPGRHLSAYNPLTAAFVIGGSGGSGTSGAAAGRPPPAVGLAGPAGHGLGAAHGGDVPHGALPIVHEEPPSGSACLTSQGSRASSAAPPPRSYDRRRRRGSADAAYGPGSCSPPGMLQQDRLLLGAQDVRSSRSQTSPSQRAFSGVSSYVDASSGPRRDDRSSGRDATTSSGPMDVTASVDGVLRRCSGPSFGAAGPLPGR